VPATESNAASVIVQLSTLNNRIMFAPYGLQLALKFRFTGSFGLDGIRASPEPG
jgi:hypothetical protein